MTFPDLPKDWFGNVPKDLLAGLVVALALIPEAIAFSIIAGVDPQVGLYASFCIAVVTAFAGGRPGLISAATGAMALLMGTLVREHGLQYLLAATLLTGLLQIVAGFLRLGDALKYVSRSVMTGFVNALAILIFMAQLPELRGVGWTTYAMVAAGLAIIYLLPRVTKAVPSPLVCIVVLTVVAVSTGMDLRTVGDMGQLPSTLPVFLWPQVPLNLEMAATDEMLQMALRHMPDTVTLVPEKREERTTEGGLDVIGQEDALRPVVAKLRDAGIVVSMFVDPDAAQCDRSLILGASTVELHTGDFCEATTAAVKLAELQRLSDAAEHAHGIGLAVAAGHGIDYRNVADIMLLPHVEELNIGHAIVARALFVGFERAVHDMLRRMHRLEL